MKLIVKDATVKLHVDQMLKLQGARGTCLICREGVLWITQEGNARDDVLVPGRSISVATAGTVLIQALEVSALTIASSEIISGRDLRLVPA